MEGYQKCYWALKHRLVCLTDSMGALNRLMPLWNYNYKYEKSSLGQSTSYVGFRLLKYPFLTPILVFAVYL